MFHVTVPLMIAAAMPSIFTAIAKVGAFTPRDNRETRNWQAQLTGWRQRAHWAHLNSFEAFPPFAVALLTSHLASPNSPTAVIAAWGFIAARVAYGACYIADVAALRSLVWFAGMGCIATLFVTAL
jgi:uncharacterized MAPEG superfamily protein